MSKAKIVLEVCSKLMLSVLIVCPLAVSSVNADSIDGIRIIAVAIPSENRAHVASVIGLYSDRCVKLAPKGEPNELTIADNPTYEIVIDDSGATATVLYTDFSCGELGPTWCGTGGCDTYIFVEGKAFSWLSSFTPYTLQIPTNDDTVTQTVVLLRLHGGCSKSGGKKQAYGAFGCYEIALRGGNQPNANNLNSRFLDGFT